MLGALFALLAALAFSSNAVLVRRGVVLATPGQVAFVTVITGVPLFLIAAIVSGQLFRVSELSLPSYGYLAAGGVINYIAGRLCNYRAIEALGAARAAPFQALTLPYSVVVAFLFLGESVTLPMALGVMLIMSGPLIMLERRNRQPAAAAVVAAGDLPPAANPGFELRQTEGYVMAVLAAVAYGSSPILFRAAVQDASGLTVLSGLVAYSAAALVLLAGIRVTGQQEWLRALNPPMLRVFFGASFSVFLAQTLRFLALSLAPVAVVTALERMNSVFTLVMSWFLNRALEMITLRVVIGILASTAGALLLVAALA